MSEKHRAACPIYKCEYKVFAEGAGEQFFRHHPSPTSREEPGSVAEHTSIGGDHRRVIPTRRLDDPPLRRVIHVHQPEPLRVPVRPLEVVEESPRVVSTEIDALLQRFVRRAQMLSVVL